MLIYLGRRGLSRFVLDVARAGLADTTLDTTIMISRQNENYGAFSELAKAHLAVDTFSSNAGAILQAWRIPIIRHRLRAFIERNQPEVVIELMTHAWSSFLAPVIKSMGVRYIPIIHDGQTHPGDYRSASIAMLTRRALFQADRVLTLSRAVKGRLEASGAVPSHNIFTLFHPDLDFGGRHALEPPKPGEPLRLLFFGRMMAYKGLPVFLDMADDLRQRGVAVEVGVFGEGNLGASAERLAAMGAEVINRWLTEAEIGTLLPRFHAVVLSHITASQSGVIATAMGAGLPVIATPVGGIVEQIIDRETGILAGRADARALADAAQLMISNPTLYRHICRQIVASKESRSTARFFAECINIATAKGEPNQRLP